MDDFNLIPYYVVQTFTEIDGRLVPDMPLDVSSASEAANLALAFQTCKAGVVAFEWTEEVRHGRHMPPFVLASFGKLSGECADWLRPDEPEDKTTRKRRVKAL